MYKSWMWKQRSFREQHMGDEGGGGTGGTGEVQQPDETQQTDSQQPEDETPTDEQQPAVAASAEGDDEVVISFGDETPPAANDDEVDGKPAPQWVKDLRKADREKAKKIRELEQKLAGTAQPAPAAPTVGEKPTLEACDFDPDRFETELTAWHDRKRKADELAAATRQEEEAQQAAWNQKVETYKAAKASLKVPDFDDAEHVVTSTLSPTQQAIILKLPKPELMVYAIGKNPAKVKELAAIKDPIDFAFAAAKLETQLKVAPRKIPPAPERVVGGTAAGATSVDNTLARLEAEADRTGDRSKVLEYRRNQRRQAA